MTGYFIVACIAGLFWYLIGYTRGWHKALENNEVFEPKPIDKIWK